MNLRLTDNPMELLQEIDACRLAMARLRRDGRRVGLVPTMGALHDGHLSLVRAARKMCDAVVVSIFVNPTQFGPGEDFESYPKTTEADLDACRSEMVDFVFSPKVSAMYPDGADMTSVHVSGLTEGLCGASRPGHFDGVTTIVSKLFNIIPADAAFFGEKDYQQLMVIKQMVGDLNMPIEIVGCPIIREKDGLALSSRNAYLSEVERMQAQCLNQSLMAACEKITSGQVVVDEIRDGIQKIILDAGPAEIDYIEIVDAVSLTPLPKIDRPARICLAVLIGGCRLIDNVAVDVPL